MSALLVAVVLLPALFAAAARILPRVTRTFAVLGAFASVVTTGAAGWAFAASGGGAQALPVVLAGETILAVDALASALLVASAVLLFIVVLAAPAREIEPRSIAGLFALEALVFGTFAAAHVVTTVLAWAAVGLPFFALSRAPSVPRRVSRKSAVLVLGSSVPLVVVALVHRGPPDDLFLSVLLIAVLGRMGLVPLHTWVAPALADMPSTLALPLIGTCTGPYLLARFAAPIAAWNPAHGLAVLGALAVVGALHTALLAFAERRFRYAIAYVIVSQTTLVFAGLCTADPVAMRGAMLFSIGEAFAATGLVIATRAVVARVGHVDLTRHHGLHRDMPRFASAHLVCVLATIGFPGFVSYAGEDLLLEGTSHHQLPVVIALAVIAALNGVTAFRAFARVFFGPPSELAAARPPDMLPRKRVLFAALLVAQITFGLMPMTLLRHLPASALAEAPLIRR